MPEPVDPDGVYVVGLAVHDASVRNTTDRLEEMVWRTAASALEDAGLTRAAVDLVVLGACDELDGRTISSMLLAAPAGAYLKDEIKVSDSGAMAFGLGVARIASGEFDIGLVSSWCKSSKTDVDQALAFSAEPFFTRPLGLTRSVADGLLAQAIAGRWGVDDEEIAERVVSAYRRAAANPRGLGHATPTSLDILASEPVATPLRELHRAPESDGAVSIVLASGRWLTLAGADRALARVAGVGWAVGQYRLDQARLRDLGGLQPAWAMACRQAGITDAASVDVFEVDAQTAYHEAAMVRMLGIERGLSPSGGPFAQNPYVCTGLVHIAEAALQVAGRADGVQVDGARRAVGHGTHGFAAQGHVFAILDRQGGAR